MNEEVDIRELIFAKEIGMDLSEAVVTCFMLVILLRLGEDESTRSPTGDTDPIDGCCRATEDRRRVRQDSAM